MHPQPPNATNSSSLLSDQPYQRSKAEIVLGSLVTLTIVLTSILGNTAVVIVSYWDHALRVQSGNLLIVNLALTDIMTSLFVMLPSAVAVANDGWPLGRTVCKANALFNFMFFCSSSFNICLISVDRAIAVLQPLKYTSWMTMRLMVAICTWLFLQNFIIGLFCSMPEWIVYDYREAVCTLHYSQGGPGLDWLSAGASTFCYWIPAFFMGFCNAVIIFTANSSKNAVQPLFTRNSSSDAHMRKTIKSLLVVVLVYYICYSPFSILKQTKIHSDFHIPPWIDYMTTILIFMASATNPFIYAIFRKDYREAFKKLLKMIVEKCSFSF